MELVIKTRNLYNGTHISFGKFPPGKQRTTFSGIWLISQNFQWNEPKSHVPFTSQPEFLEVLGKWKKAELNNLYT